jgi:hypothetical protein
VMPFLNVCINVCVFPPHGLAVRPRAREWPVDRRWHVGIHQLRRPCVNPYAAWFPDAALPIVTGVPRPTESSQLSRADGGCCSHHAALQESFCTSLLGTVIAGRTILISDCSGFRPGCCPDDRRTLRPRSPVVAAGVVSHSLKVHSWAESSSDARPCYASSIIRPRAAGSSSEDPAG